MTKLASMIHFYKANLVSNFYKTLALLVCTFRHFSNPIRKIGKNKLQNNSQLNSIVLLQNCLKIFDSIHFNLAFRIQQKRTEKNLVNRKGEQAERSSIIMIA